MKATEEMCRALHAHWNKTDSKITQSWDGLVETQKVRWRAMAQVVLDMASQIERDPPSDYVEARVEKIEVQQNANFDGQTMSIKLLVPRTSRYTRNPGAQQRALSGFAMAAADQRNVVRMSIVSDDKVKSDFARIESDGTMRDYSPNEATW